MKMTFRFCSVDKNDLNDNCLIYYWMITAYFMGKNAIIDTGKWAKVI